MIFFNKVFWPVDMLTSNIPYRVGRALINFMSGKPDLAKAPIQGLIDGYRGVKGDKNI